MVISKIPIEKLNPATYKMELSPVYCDLAVSRWENFTRQKAVKL